MMQMLATFAEDGTLQTAKHGVLTMAHWLLLAHPVLNTPATPTATATALSQLLLVLKHELRLLLLSMLMIRFLTRSRPSMQRILPKPRRTT